MRYCLLATSLILFLVPGPATAEDTPHEQLPKLEGFLATLGLDEELEPIRVILDPGHGGADLGARSSKSVLEKNVTLSVVRMTQKKLAEHERIETLSVRSDDQTVPAVERIEFANANKGDLYVGIHADGGLEPRTHALKIFVSLAEEKNERRPDVWATLNGPYQEESVKLAEAVKQRLEALNLNRDVDIVRSGRLPIGGAAMPAVIVEPVDLSNPEDEIRLAREEYLETLATALASAVVDYLENSGRLMKQQRREP